MMDEDEIYYLMRHKKDFIGVFARNELPVFDLQTKATLIVNTQDRWHSGEHWIALKIDRTRCFYFDPLAMLPMLSIITKMKNLTLYYTENAAQNIWSTNCGYHVVYYLYNNVGARNDTEAITYINRNLV